MTALLSIPVTTAVAAGLGPVFRLQKGIVRNLSLEAIFTYGSGGTSADAYVQTSMDGGATWFDIANFHFTTASGKKAANLSGLTAVTTQLTTFTDGSLAANTVLDGFLGDPLRVKYVTVGTYAASTTLAVFASSNARIGLLV